MKTFLVFTCIIVALMTYVQADECKVDGHSFKVGDKFSPPGKCIQFECTGPNNYVGKTCADSAAVDPCKYIPEDTSKPYPQCCPRYDC